MRKMFVMKILIPVLLLSFQTIASAQNCTDYLMFRNPTFMYKVDSQSKSATCETGKIYKLVLTLTQGKEYRLSFFASAIFDNKITFKIIDKSSNAVQVDLPGESANNEKGTAVLRPYLQNGKMEHPYFSFLPENTTNLEIIIEVKAIEKTGADPERGCVGVFLQNKTVENIGFSN